MRAPRSPFAKFEASLAAERRAEQLAQDVEIVGAVPARRKRTSRPPMTKDGKYIVEVSLDPRVTCKAAMIAVREKSTTSEVIVQWLTNEARGIEQKERPIETVTLSLAIGPHGMSEELANELLTEAKILGVDPGALATVYLKLGLKAERERRQLGIK